MSAPTTSLPVLFIAAQHAISLVERATRDDERSFELTIDGQLRGEIFLLAYYQPSVAVGRAEMAAWGGTALYLASLSGTDITRIEQRDEIHAA